MFWFTYILIGIFLIAIVIVYGLRRREVGKKAAARDFLNSVMFVGVFAIIGIGFFLLLFIAGKDYALASIFPLFTVVFCVYFFTWLRHKMKAGPVLLDLGRPKWHKLNIVIGVWFMLSGILQLVELLQFSREIRIINVSQSLFGLSCGVFFLFWGLSHFEIREGGILYLDRFAKWEQIKSCEWEGKNGLTLTLRFKQRFPFFRTRSLPIPDLHKDTVENLLARYLQDDKSST